MRLLLALVALWGASCASVAVSRRRAVEDRLLTRLREGGPNHAHALRLARLAPRFAAAEGARADLVEVAALLHDATKEDGAGTPRERLCTHHEQGAAWARQVLPPLGYSAPEVELVAGAIEAHMGPLGGDPVRKVVRFMSKFCERPFPSPATPEARVLYDVDMLDLMTVNGMAKVVELRQTGQGFPAETVEASALTGEDSAFKSVLDAGQTLLTQAGRTCGDALQAHTRAFLDGVDWARTTTVADFKAAVRVYLTARPLPACFGE